MGWTSKMELKYSSAWGWGGWALAGAMATQCHRSWILGGPGEEKEELQLPRNRFKGQKAANILGSATSKIGFHCPGVGVSLQENLTS